MADHNLPVLATAYALFLSSLSDRIKDLMLGNDAALVTVTNQPTGTIRWNSSLNRWEKWSGSAWGFLATGNNYAISITGTAAVATTANAAPWSGITGKPTTLGGYGITDAAPINAPNFTGVAQVGSIEIGYRSVPLLTSVATAALAGRGKCYDQNANITIPSGVYASGDVISIENALGTPITIIQGASLVLRLAGTASTGNRTLAGHGICTIWHRNGNEALISGSGLT